MGKIIDETSLGIKGIYEWFRIFFGYDVRGLLKFAIKNSSWFAKNLQKLNFMS